MKTLITRQAYLLSGFLGLFLLTGMLSAAGFEEPKASDQTADETAKVNEESSKSDSVTTDAGVTRVPIDVARDRAKLMHSIYSTTLGVMHDRYFHADRSIVPARAMEDVFTELEQETGSKANWISVNLKAMSINHEPSTDFEKRAAKAIATGESEVETTEDGYYRRASAIPMTGGCISCHAGVFNQSPKSRKFAALVISIPVESKSVIP